MVIAPLDAEHEAYHRIHQAKDLFDAKLYPSQKVSDLVTTAEWEQVIQKIETSLSVDPNAISVTLGALAFDRQRFDQIYNPNVDGFAKRVNDALTACGLAADIPVIASRYGIRAMDWKPFGGPDTAETILNRVKTQINGMIGPDGKKVRWELLGNRFHGGSDSEASEELQEHYSNPCVFLIDPISLCHSSMVARLTLLDDYFEDDKTLLLVFAPGAYQFQSQYLQVIQQSATAFFNRFHDSKVRRRYALSGFNIVEKDIGRLMRWALGPRVYGDASTSGSPYTRPGSTS
jgi:hypothetical protein